MSRSAICAASARQSLDEAWAKSSARVFVRILYFDSRAWARVWSLEAVRDTRRTLKFFEASCVANSRPIPSEAPVMRAQEDGGPKVES